MRDSRPNTELPALSPVVSPEDGLFEWFAAEVLANAEALRGGADVGEIVVTLDEREDESADQSGSERTSGSLIGGDSRGSRPAGVPTSRSSSVTCFSCGQTIDNEGGRA